MVLAWTELIVLTIVLITGTLIYSVVLTGFVEKNTSGVFVVRVKVAFVEGALKLLWPGTDIVWKN